MNMQEFMVKMTEAFPDATVEQDSDGQLVIYTNLTVHDTEAHYSEAEVVPMDDIVDKDTVDRALGVLGIYSLSDCVNWDTNSQGDCGGRVEKVNDVIVCENCRNK